MKRTLSLILACTLVLGMFMPSAWAADTSGVTETETTVVVERENYTIQIEKDGFRYGFYQPVSRIMRMLQAVDLLKVIMVIHGQQKIVVN